MASVYHNANVSLCSCLSRFPTSLQACASEGAKVIATDVNEEKLAELQGTDGTYVVYMYLLLNISDCTNYK